VPTPRARASSPLKSLAERQPTRAEAKRAEAIKRAVAEVERTAAIKRQADEAYRRTLEPYRDAIRAAVDALEADGWGDAYKQVADAAGVSRQAVRQFVKRAR
jgi:DNA-directed RNA polymerase specialized sigma24 family protein